ncbi:MAG TPA: hypothetical protein VGK73_03275 [Polyangiaceae bacterium]
MLTPDVRFEGFTHAQWTCLGRAFRPAPFEPRERSEREEAEPAGPSGGVVAVTTGSVLRKLVSTRLGRIDPRDQPWPESLESLAARHGARWAAEITAGSLDEFADRFGERLAPGQDFMSQLLEMLGILRELESEGLLSVWPTRFSEWTVPSGKALSRALDLTCPDGKALVLGIFDGGELATCLVAERRGSGFARLVGPDELAREMGLLSGDFRRDHCHLAEVVEKRVAPIAVGCYGELATFQRLSSTREPGVWARAVAAQDVVIAPWMPAVAVPLGLDAGRAAFQELRNVAARFGAAHWLSREGPLGQVLANLERPPWLGDDVREFLGFDPWQLFVRLVARGERPS